MDEQISADMLRAVAHPLRLAALVELERRERAAAELATALGVPEEALAEHLAVLAAAGLIVGGGGERGGALRPAALGWAALAARLRDLQGGAR